MTPARKIAARAALGAALLWAASAPAQEAGYVRGHAGAESWSSRFSDRHSHAASVLGAVELRRALTPGADLLLALEGKAGLHAAAADAFDLRELLFVTRHGDTELSVGIGRVFWGVAEARHLVNIINQPDYRFASDGLTALGQPMLSAATVRYGVRWQAFLLPCYRPQALPRQGRTRGAAQADNDSGAWIDMRCTRLDSALRAEWSDGPADIGLAYFNGHARDPVAHSEMARYPVLRRWSLDAQLTLGSFLWKAEALREASSWHRRHASVAGVEYTFAQLASSVDLGILYENLRESDCPAFTCANVVGVRIGANDSAGTQLLVTRSTAVGTHAASYLVRAERRWSHHVSMKLEAQRSRDDWLLRLAARYGF